MMLESPQLLIPGVEFLKLSTATKDTPRQLESQEGFPLVLFSFSAKEKARFGVVETDL
jgi:hypothetical protein